MSILKTNMTLHLNSFSIVYIFLSYTSIIYTSQIILLFKISQSKYELKLMNVNILI